MCNFAPQFDYLKILITTYLIIKNNDCSTRDRKSTRLNSSHANESRMPSSA